METFVLRIWVPGTDQPARSRPLRGVVEHVATGSSATFRSVHDLAAHLDAMTRGRSASRAITKGTPR